MDNFMDKLARRFNAGELIQANGEAEARENQRLKEQTAEYDKIMQEIRRLNLKTVEISEQVSQMVACGIEQLESYAAKDIHALEAEQNLMEELKQSLEKAEQDQDQEQLAQLGRKLEEIESRLQKGVTDSMYRLEASVSQAEEDIAQSRQSLESALATLEKNLSARMSEKKEDGALLEAVSATLSENARAEQESAKQIKEMIVNIRLYMDEMQKHIEDYVHKEDVKVYRNVQAVLMEQTSAKTRELSDHMDQLEQAMGRAKGTKPLILLAILLSAASAALQILQIVGIL